VGQDCVRVSLGTIVGEVKLPFRHVSSENLDFGKSWPVRDKGVQLRYIHALVVRWPSQSASEQYRSVPWVWISPCFWRTKATAMASWSVLYRPRRLKYSMHEVSPAPFPWVHFDLLVFPGEESAWGVTQADRRCSPSASVHTAPASSSPLSHSTVVRSAPCRSRRPRLPFCRAPPWSSSPHHSGSQRVTCSAALLAHLTAPISDNGLVLAKCRLLPAAVRIREGDNCKVWGSSLGSLACFCASDRPLATSFWLLSFAMSIKPSKRIFLSFSLHCYSTCLLRITCCVVITVSVIKAIDNNEERKGNHSEKHKI
jgi:hypothetical protein